MHRIEVVKWLFVPRTNLKAFEDYAAYSVGGAAKILSREWVRLAVQDENHLAILHFGFHVSDQEHFFQVFVNPYHTCYMILRLQTDGITARNQPDGQLTTSMFIDGSHNQSFLEQSLTEACSLLLASGVHAA